ncbi:MAG: 2-oxoacid:acceptor oxidoreductase family protein [Patescibacteria group bacterium]
MSIKILLAGEGGQGIQTIAKSLSKSAVTAGFECSYIPSFGVEQRGTPSIAFLIIGRKEIRYPRFEKADYVIVLQKRAIKAIKSFVDEKTKIIFDSSTISAKALPETTAGLFGIPATKIAYEKMIPKVFNVLVLGKLTDVFNIDYDLAWSGVVASLGKKFQANKTIEEKNREAFDFGRHFVFEVANFTKPAYVPSTKQITTIGHHKKAEIIPARCKGCGICIAKCPVGALKYSDELGVYATPIPEVDLEKCIACGNCFRFCPDAAIKVEKTD